ncbi:hypothetical protein BGW36DRAFT_370209 [Talaromyces proteolyticus]|uniref:DUF7136 domain-containing protein n=1 Tax=Talaromyces proteolyticus TaxID=1131652 RepID=A0AAD4L470_9EURO|nr:uncharacterized protein BGW36DRAFT_370209 [Talaromyces proteolyticus]KAH8703903.1 hypothetical protein BGW36DRAFT_370209 [Talaromyces proteolyticus]
MSPTFLGLFLAFILGAVGAEALTFPATVEVDLVFPRNDTYAPAALIPVVFAIQNAQLAASLDPKFQFTVTSASDSSNEITTAILDLTNATFSRSDPYYALGYIHSLNGIEGQWVLAWSLSTGNCSGSSDDTVNIGHLNQNTNVFFTTKNGTQPPDLVAASADNSTCAATDDSYTFNVTGTLDVADTIKYDGRSSCAVLSPTLPTANPCAAAVNVAAAASISAAITSTACAWQNPNVTCPSSSSSAAGRVMMFPGIWSVCLLWIGLNFHFWL